MGIENTASKDEKRTYWESHIKQWKASGETQSGYCRQKQLKPHLFTYWKQVFDSKRKPENHTPAKNGFVSVQLSQPKNPSAQEIIIHLPNGIRIENIQSNNIAFIQEMARWKI